MKLTSAQQIIQKHNVKSNEISEGSKVESVISRELNLIHINFEWCSETES